MKKYNLLKGICLFWLSFLMIPVYAESQNTNSYSVIYKVCQLPVVINGYTFTYDGETTNLTYLTPNGDSVVRTTVIEGEPVFDFESVAACSAFDLKALNLRSGSITGLSLKYYDQAFTELASTIVTTSGTYHVIGQGFDSGTGCADTSTITITIYTPPVVSVSDTLTYCHGEQASVYYFTGTPDVTYQWKRLWGEDLGLTQTEGYDSIPSFSALNTGVYPLQGVYRIQGTDTNTSCKSEEKYFLITVNPMPALAPSSVSNKIYCNQTMINEFEFTGIVPDANYEWMWESGDTIIGLPESGVNKMPSFLSVNSGSAPLVATYNVTATYTYANHACNNGDTIWFSITILPTPDVMIDYAHQTLCSGDTLKAISFTSNVTGTTFHWSRLSGYVAGLPVSGTGNINTQALTNTGRTVQKVIYEVIPIYTSNDVVCEGHPQTFSITVNPDPVIFSMPDFSYCADETVPAYTFGNMQDVTYHWNRQTGDSVGLPDGGTGPLLSFVAFNDTLENKEATYQLQAIFTHENVSCILDTTFVITVHPRPQITGIRNYVFCSEDKVDGLSFILLFDTLHHPQGTIYSWEYVSGAPDIGLTLTIGTDSMPAFTAKNNGSEVIMATYAVRPSYGRCAGTSQFFTITVNPLPKINAVPDVIYCAGSAIPERSFSGNLSQASYHWKWIQGTDTIAGLPMEGYGPMPSFTAVNDGDTLLRAEFSVMMYNAGGLCADSTSFEMIVEPTPKVYPVADLFLCNESSVHIVFEGNADEFHWSLSEGPGIGIPLYGVGDTLAFDSVMVTGTQPVTATYQVVPVFNNLNSCTGNPESFTITVTPAPVLTSSVGGLSVCSGEQFIYSATSSITGTEYAWTRLPHAAINDSTGNSGMTGEINERLINTSDSVVTVIYEMTLTANSCTQAIPVKIPVAVNPSPAIELDQAGVDSVCSGEGDIVLGYRKLTNLPMEYTLAFTTEGLAVGFQNITNYMPLPDSSILLLMNSHTTGGSYPVTLTIRSGSCEKTYTAVIRVFDPVKIVQQPQSQLNLCDTISNIMLQVKAEGDVLSYQWYYNGTPIADAISDTYIALYTPDLEGEYYVLITGMCNTIESHKIEVKSNQYSIEEKWDDVIFIDNSSGLFVDYQWYKNGNPVSQDGQAQYYTDKNGLNGNYHVRMYLADGSYLETCPKTYVKEKSLSVMLYPNPVNPGTTVTLQLEETDEQQFPLVEVFDMQGRKLLSQRGSGNRAYIQAPQVSGMYIIRIYTDTSDVIIQRLIVN